MKDRLNYHFRFCKSNLGHCELGGGLFPALIECSDLDNKMFSNLCLIADINNFLQNPV